MKVSTDSSSSSSSSFFFFREDEAADVSELAGGIMATAASFQPLALHTGAPASDETSERSDAPAHPVSVFKIKYFGKVNLIVSRIS